MLPEQLPSMQVSPPLHITSQPPQWFGSLEMFTHAPSQQVWPAVQQLVPWLPVHSVRSHGQTLHWLPQQYCPEAQQCPPQQF